MALQAAIDAIDALINKLQRGGLLTSDPANAAAGKAPAQAAKPAAPQAKTAGRAADAKPQKAAKPAPTKSAVPAKPAAHSAADDIFSKAHLAVGKVVSAEAHADSDKLYICKVDVGAGQERQVVTGLRKHVAADELAGSGVVLVLNLKPAKLGGFLSEAMILTGSAKQADGGELVRLLRPAEGAGAGEVVFQEGGAAPPEFPKTLKQWSKIMPDLAVKAGRACYMDKPLMTAAGPVTAPADIPDGAAIC